MFLFCTKKELLPIIFFTALVLLYQEWTLMIPCPGLTLPGLSMCQSLIILVSNILGFSSEVILIVVVCKLVLFYLVYAHFAIDFNKQYEIHFLQK
jgi:hypothetical protein